MIEQHDSDDPSTLDVAKALLAEGFVPLPIVAGRKIPMEKEWTKKPIPTADDLARWFADGRCNIGIRTGKLSGIAVVDVDPRHGGEDALDALCYRYGALPDTVIALTPSGGYHYYFSITSTVAIGNSVRKLGAGLDIRADGGQVLCFPSSIDGRRYEFDGGGLPRRAQLAPIPDWMLPLITESKRIEKEDKAGGVAHGRCAVYAAGGRNDALFRIAASMRNKGMADEAIRDALHAENKTHCIPPLPDSEVDTIAESVRRYEPSPAYLDTWQQGLHYGKGSRLKGTMGNLALILSNDQRFAGKIRFNTLTGMAESSAALPWMTAPGAFNDDVLLAMRAWIQNIQWSGYSMDEMSSTNAFDGVMRVAQLQPFDPLVSWLDTIEWDGISRIDSLFFDVFGTPHSDYVAAVSQILIIGAVQRAYSPGCKQDYMPILQGAQGYLKSTFLRVLFGDFFGEKCSPIFEGSDALMELRGKWCLEVAELNAFTKSEVNAVKSFLSRTVDEYRMPYARSSERHPRRCIVVGTTNEDQYLRDSTGNRRFLPVLCHQRANLSYVESNREQLFAEGVARRGENCAIDGDLIAEAMQRQEAAAIDDPWMERIADFCDANRREWLSTDEILSDCIHMDVSRMGRAEQMRVAQVLVQLGFVRKRITINGVKKWRFRRP